ncbi:unnamed protein product [Blepharisma stoltei]|uniref:Uncharacterized protein n=1 Tax=Blepharisma stoltei TaxID=1481888 RepID=A0AAU9JEL9_9CILI|nr:unnamed protein product [Blepharisma stoltei]
MNCSWRTHSSHTGAIDISMSGNTQNCFRLRKSRCNVPPSLGTTVFFYCIHRASMSKKIAGILSFAWPIIIFLCYFRQPNVQLNSFDHLE